MHVSIKRIYDEPSPDDGTRVLIDRLWPRGVRKDAAAIDVWAKELAPTTELRKWFDHDPNRFEAFAREYRQELRDNRGALDAVLGRIDKRKRLTLLTATKTLDNSHASVLKKYLEA